MLLRSDEKVRWRQECLAERTWRVVRWEHEQRQNSRTQVDHAGTRKPVKNLQHYCTDQWVSWISSSYVRFKRAFNASFAKTRLSFFSLQQVLHLGMLLLTPRGSVTPTRLKVRLPSLSYTVPLVQ